METIKCDVCVIGAGSGGLSFAAGAAQMGADVVLIEGHKMGGDCLNYGCVPSKALLSAAKLANSHRQGGMGIDGTAPRIDFGAVMGHVQDVIAQIEPHDSQERFEGLGVHVIRDMAQFVSEHEVVAGPQRIKARRFVIATGSRPFVPPIPGLESVPYLTNETIFDRSECPAHLLILGGGPIGVELAQAHRRLGAEVTIVEAAKLLSREDPEAADVVRQKLLAEGVRLIEGLAVTEVRAEEGVGLLLADGRSLSGSHLLIAAGRKANVETLNPQAAGIVTNAAGIEVDAKLRTSNRRVYAIGDVAGQGQFTHLAGYHAGVVIRPILFGLPAKTRSTHIPHVTYTDPELAQIGMTEAEARALHGGRLQVFRADLAQNDRALAGLQGKGWIKLMVVKGKPVGVTLVGPQAGELISLWALVMANSLSLKAVASAVLPYPTLAELNKRVAGAYFTPKLFDNPMLKRVIRLLQRVLP